MENGLVTADGTKVLTVEGYERFINAIPEAMKAIFEITVLHQLDQKIIYPHYDFKHLTEKYFEIGMKLNDFSIQLVKYWIRSYAVEHHHIVFNNLLPI
jgi:hypothetical protein